MSDSSVLASENGGEGQPYQTLAEHLRRIPSVPATLPKVESGLGAVSPEAKRRYELEKKWGSQPPYNASAAVTALRLAKAGQAKPMLTYSGYWEWSKESESKSKPRLIDMGDMTDAMTDRIGSSDEVEGGVGRAGRVQSKREEDIINAESGRLVRGRQGDHEVHRVVHHVPGVAEGIERPARRARAVIHVVTPEDVA